MLLFLFKLYISRLIINQIFLDRYKIFGLKIQMSCIELAEIRVKYSFWIFKGSFHHHCHQTNCCMNTFLQQHCFKGQEHQNFRSCLNTQSRFIPQIPSLHLVGQQAYHQHRCYQQNFNKDFAGLGLVVYQQILEHCCSHFHSIYA